jgi:hypothetical protein
MKRAALAVVVMFVGLFATQALATPVILCSADGTQCCVRFDDGSVGCF